MKKDSPMIIDHPKDVPSLRRVSSTLPKYSFFPVLVGLWIFDRLFLIDPFLHRLTVRCSLTVIIYYNYLYRYKQNTEHKNTRTQEDEESVPSSHHYQLESTSHIIEEFLVFVGRRCRRDD